MGFTIRATAGDDVGRARRLAGRGFVVVAVLVAALLVPGAAGAAVFNVTGTSDGTGGCAGSNCPTLRSAVIASNLLMGPNTINVPPGTYTLTLTPTGADDGMTGDLHIASSVTVAGAGAGAGGTTIQGSGDRLFDIAPTATAVTLSGLRITGGSSQAFGGAIQAGGASLTLTGDALSGNTTSTSGFGGAIRMNPAGAGTLTVSSSTLSSNTAAESGTTGGGFGGAIMFEPGAGPSTMSITDSAFDSNTAQSGSSSGGGFGGALMFEPTGTSTLTVNRSTFRANAAAGSVSQGGFGGAIMFEPSNNPSSVGITNSTFTANQAGGTSAYGGSIMFQSSGVTSSGALTHDTIVGNAANGTDRGGGIYVQGPPVTITNSIISGNTSGGVANNCTNNGGSIPTAGHNVEFGMSCGFDANADPMVFALADNGGPTQTMALAAASPARDAAPTLCPATDQRGAPRPDDPSSACDLGAFEFGSTVPGGGTPAGGPPAGGTPGGVTPLPPGGSAPQSHQPTNTLVVSRKYVTLPDGSVVIEVTVTCDGSCTLTAQDGGAQTRAVTAAKKNALKRRALIRRTSKTVSARGTVTIKLRLRPTAAAAKILTRKGKLTARVRLILTSSGGTASKPITVTLTKPRKRHR